MNPIARAEIYAVVLVVLALAATGAYFYAYHQGVIHERGEWEKKQAAATKADLEDLRGAVNTANQIAMGTQDLLNRKKATSIIDRGVLEREIRTNTIYAADCLPPTGVLQWQSISASGTVLPDRPAVGQPDNPVPVGNVPTDPGRKGGIAAIKPPGGAIGLRRVPN